MTIYSTRVSNEIGTGNIRKAKSAVSVTLKLSCFVALTVLLSLSSGHYLWAQHYTFSPIIIREFASVTPFLCMSILYYSAQGVLSGVARACGWQHLAAWTNQVTFYFIGMLLGSLFGFKLGLYNKGLWLGLMSGLFFQATTLLLITIRSKWNSKVDLF